MQTKPGHFFEKSKPVALPRVSLYAGRDMSFYSPSKLLTIAGICVAAFGIGAEQASAISGSWTEYANVQYGNLSKGNKDASVNLVSLDVYVPDEVAPGEKLPLVIMFHGGGWREGDKADTVVVENKVPFFTSNGFVFVSANYQLSPAVKYPVHVQDVADAIMFMYEHADEYNVDRDNITIMGHSAGAQLVALVAVDGQFLRKAGGSSQVLKRVILLDGIYDFLKRLKNDDMNNKDAIYGAFGRNPIILSLASPALIIKKASQTYTPPMLNFFGHNPTKIPLDIQLIANLRKNGILCGGIICRKMTHKDIDWYVGLPGSEMNQPILDFLSGVNPETLDGQIFKTPGPTPP